MVGKGRFRYRIAFFIILLTGGTIGLLALACVSPDGDATEPALDIPRSSAERPDDAGYFIQPAEPVVRGTAVSAVSDCPDDIDANSDVWKIWQINRWVALNVSYVSDPLGHNYYAYARETLDAGGGDCDDFAILLASMYESVGLDAAIASIDTVGDSITDHMACLVY
jgi:hypothetical protein